ncbi:MAG: TSUP family transporter [Elusimicrobiota bacterium]
MNLESLSLTSVSLLMGVGLIGGIVESSAGGSGLVTLPTLLMLGVDPIRALATNKFQYSFGAIVSVARFSKAGLIQQKGLIPLILAALLGGAFGAYVLTLSSAQVIATLAPLFLIASALYFALSPSFSDKERAPRMKLSMVALFVIPFIAFYDGFFGTGSASLYMVAFILLQGYHVRQATAVTKLVDFASGGAALVVLTLKGHVLLVPGLILAIGQTAGAYIGSGMVLKWGSKWVKPVIVIVTIAMSFQLLYKHRDMLVQLFK